MSRYLNAANLNLTWKGGSIHITLLSSEGPGPRTCTEPWTPFTAFSLMLLFPCPRPNHRLSTHTSNPWVALFQVRLSDIRIGPVFLHTGNVREIYIGSPLSFKYDLRLHISVSPVYLISFPTGLPPLTLGTWFTLLVGSDHPHADSCSFN
jgi:hypothetical protein